MSGIQIDVQTGEVTETEYSPEELAALPKPDPNQVIKSQIRALEDQQTTRRMREAALGKDNNWLVDLNDQIAALRAQLTKE